MSRDPTFGKEMIRSQFEDLSDSIDEKIIVYLIGGGAMTLSEQKTATKDIDLVVESSKEYQRVSDGLREFGYEPQQDLDEEYEDLGAAIILEKEDRRFDVFNQQVAGELIITDSIKSRSESIIDDPPLHVRRFSNEDIFLFKSVANRPDDLDDMVTLLASGLNFEVIVNELVRQVEVLGADEFVTSIDRKLGKLQEQRGIRPDLIDEIKNLNEISIRAGDVRTLTSLGTKKGGIPGMSVSQIESKMGCSREEVEEAIDWLEKLGAVQREGERVVLNRGDFQIE